jgi:hypothetical protein
MNADRYQHWHERGDTHMYASQRCVAGRTGHDLALRATLAKNALGAQLASEVIEAQCAVDADDRPLHGQHVYQLHFRAGQTPPGSAFWNLATHGHSSIGSTTDGLTTNRDGSLTLYLQRDRPDDETAAANWLPAPDSTFNLVMRFYGPSSTVLDGSYRLPAVTKSGPATVRRWA